MKWQEIVMGAIRPLKLIFKLLILTVLAIWVWVLTIGAVQSPRITIESQPESPLHLSVLQITPSERTGSSVVTLMVNNESASNVRAYAVALSRRNSKTGVLLTNAHNDQQMLRANEMRPITLRKTDEEIVNGISFSIDYVEFEDGSKWGSDTFDSANSLAGEREGIRQAVGALADRLKIQGVDSLSTHLDQVISAISTPSARSPNWDQGFERGVNSVHARLKRAHENGGEEKLLAEWERIVAESKKTKAP